MKAAYESISNDSTSFLVRLFEEYGFSAPYHFHPELELTLITTGTGKRFVGTSMHPFAPGDLVLLGGNLPHCWRSDTTEVTSASVVVQFKEDFMGGDFLQRPELVTIKKLLDLSSAGIVFTGDTTELASMLLQVQAEPDSLQRLVGLLHLLDRLAKHTELLVLNSLPAGGQLTTGEAERLHAVFACIVDNYRDRISLQSAAAAANMTVPAFCRYFKRMTRKTFLDTVTDYRIGYATRELVHTDKPVEQVGFESGFNDISNFFKTFKRRCGVSPLAYRHRFLKVAAAGLSA